MSTHKPRKRFGQNFLQDPFAIRQIVDAINPRENDHLIEIGPGLGSITTSLLPFVAKLDAIELDRDLIPKLETKFNNKSNFIIHQADILQFDLPSIIPNKSKARIVGNLPYNISTPLLFKLLDYRYNILDLHFMVQKEVADRLAATPGGENYGRLSVMIQYYYMVEFLFEVKPTCFKPAPKVNSAFIRLIPHEKPKEIPMNFELFKDLTTKAFNQRRKTIHNSLKSMFAKEDFVKLNIDPTLRAENLSIEDYIKLSNYLVNNNPT